MPRPLRPCVLGGWFHIGNRALHRRAMFDSEADARRFLALLAELCLEGLIELNAFCIMTNHFHLLIRDVTGAMSRALQWLESMYVSKFNRAHERDGTLLKGRFFSKQVKSDAYRRAVIAYIDANPVDARIVSTAGEYPYSSTHHYARPSGPPWLTRTWIEKAVREATGARVYDPLSYPLVFGRKWTPAALRWFERFVAGPAQDDSELDRVLTARPEHVQAWLDRCAREADGTLPRPPVADPESVLAMLTACEVARPQWRIRQRHRLRSGWNLVKVGLLHDLAAESLSAIGRRIELPGRTVCGLYPQHRRRFEADVEYRTVVQATAASIVAACHRDSPIGV